MAQTKWVGKGVVIGLAAIAVILVASNIYVYTSMQNQISGLNTDKTNLTNHVNTLTSQKNTLNATYQNYVSTHSYTNAQYNTLNSNYNALNAPKLSSLSLSFSDNDPLFGDNYLRVYGQVWNVGNKTAYNSKIHVILYRSAVIVDETDVLLGAIIGENKINIDQQITYSGGLLTSWAYNLIWSTTP